MSVTQHARGNIHHEPCNCIHRYRSPDRSCPDIEALQTHRVQAAQGVEGPLASPKFRLPVQTFSYDSGRRACNHLAISTSQEQVHQNQIKHLSSPPYDGYV
jgi:hypothetical protein